MTPNRRRSEPSRFHRDSRHHRAQGPAQVGGVPWLISADESQMYYMAAGYEALTGLSCADLYADPDSWMDALHPDDRDRVVAAMDARGPGTKMGYQHSHHRIRSVNTS